MVTRSGREVTRTKGAPSLEDIAYHLSYLPRFGGATGDRWTVAQHSVLVYLICLDLPYPAVLGMHGLLHDAAETCINDVPIPFKTASMERLEERILRRIYREQRLDWPSAELRKAVHYADRLALYAEAKMLGLKATEAALTTNGLQSRDVEMAQLKWQAVPSNGFLPLLRRTVSRWRRR